MEGEGMGAGWVMAAAAEGGGERYKKLPEAFRSFSRAKRMAVQKKGFGKGATD